ncbi:MAG: SDR family oxidoreductase [Chitinophagales bacterium]|nr:SDR family oxidoreductase [Chitinophagales bacterium]MDW8419090.1 SDR family oxidoreductase [Chitinophagales bacterium]
MSHCALITGASKGIGKALAYACAERGIHLYLIARTEGLLKSIAEELQNRVQVNYLAADLFLPDAPERIFAHAETLGIQPDILINNAGMGYYGPFHEVDLSHHLRVMQLNMDACVRMTHHFLNVTDKHRKRYILNVASTASFQPVPNMSIYAATKAFLLFFSQGLRHELRKSRVHVTTLCPGGTETEFFNPANMQEVVKKNAAFMMKPEKVANAGLDALFKNKSVVIPGYINKIGALSAKLLPHNIVVPAAAKFFE